MYNLRIVFISSECYACFCRPFRPETRMAFRTDQGHSEICTQQMSTCMSGRTVRQQQMAYQWSIVSKQCGLEQGSIIHIINGSLRLSGRGGRPLARAGSEANSAGASRMHWGAIVGTLARCPSPSLYGPNSKWIYRYGPRLQYKPSNISCAFTWSTMYFYFGAEDPNVHAYAGCDAAEDNSLTMILSLKANQNTACDRCVPGMFQSRQSKLSKLAQVDALLNEAQRASSDCAFNPLSTGIYEYYKFIASATD